MSTSKCFDSVAKGKSLVDGGYMEDLLAEKSYILKNQTSEFDSDSIYMIEIFFIRVDL